MPSTTMPSTTAQKFARGLAWFGIGLGMAEVLAARKVSRIAGLEGHDGLIRAFGLREIASSLLILGSRDPERAVWGRVAGDGLDAALLGTGLIGRNPHKGRTLAAALLVSPVVILDCLIASKTPASR